MSVISRSFISGLVANHLPSIPADIVASYEPRVLLPTGSSPAEIDALLATLKPEVDRLYPEIERLCSLPEWRTSNDPAWTKAEGLVLEIWGSCTQDQCAKAAINDPDFWNKMSYIASCLCWRGTVSSDRLAEELQWLIDKCDKETRATSTTAQSVSEFLKNFYNPRQNLVKIRAYPWLRAYAGNDIGLSGLTTLCKSVVKSGRVQIPPGMFKKCQSNLGI